MNNRIPAVLTIAGSDSGGGAGIQADLRTFHTFRVYGSSVITAVTAQNPCDVRRVDVMPADSVKSQLECVLDQFPVQFAKTLQRAADATGVNFIGGYSALVHKGFSAGSYKDLTRVAWLNEQMWTELFMENSDYLTEEINGIINALTAYRDAMAEGNAEKLKELLREGRLAKERVDRGSEDDK